MKRLSCAPLMAAPLLLAATAHAGTPPTSDFTLVWAGDPGAGHHVELYQDNTTAQILANEGTEWASGSAPVLTPAIVAQGFVSTYQTLFPRTFLIPQELLDADARARAAQPPQAPPSNAPVPTNLPSAMGGSSSARAMTPDSSDGPDVEFGKWFWATYCTDGSKTYPDLACSEAWGKQRPFLDSGTTPGWDTGKWDTAFFLTNDAPGPATFEVGAYECVWNWVTSWFTGYQCGWRQIYSQQIQPGWAQHLINGDTKVGYTQFDANLTMNGSPISDGPLGGVMLNFYDWGTNPGGSDCNSLGCDWSF